MRRWDGAREVLGSKMQAVLSKALSNKPEERFESAAAFVDALFNEVDDSDFPVVEIEDEDDGQDATPVVLTEDLIAEEVKIQADSDYEEPIELSSGVFELDSLGRLR